MLAGTAACVGLVLAAAAFPRLFTIPGLSSILSAERAPDAPVAHYPFLELLKLVVASILGLVLTAVNRRSRRQKPQSAALEHAQILLCISGAIIMIIIGNSLARAFGIAGGAAIVRFRTPVDDPKDALMLFLLLAVGMACGLAAFGVAILATIFLCIVLIVLDRMTEDEPRTMILEVVAAGKIFPTEHVHNFFTERAILCEPREVAQGEQTTVRYRVTLGTETSIEDVSTSLMAAAGHGISSVSWATAKKNS
ncbi:MAG: hypothetical protein ACRD7E_21755 [Bryobacteraceae bacterium]